MSDPTAHLTHSARYSMMPHIVNAVRNDADVVAAGAVVLYNPRNPSELQNHPLAVVIKFQRDNAPNRQHGLQEREVVFVVASIARIKSDTAGAQEADLHADKLHLAVAKAIRSAQIDISTSDPMQPRAGALIEGDTTTEVQGLHVDGALVATTWSFKYQIFSPRKGA